MGQMSRLPPPSPRRWGLIAAAGAGVLAAGALAGWGISRTAGSSPSKPPPSASATPSVKRTSASPTPSPTGTALTATGGGNAGAAIVDCADNGTCQGVVTVSVHNNRTDPIPLGQSALGGGNAGDFAVVTDACTNTTLAADAQCTVQVAFRPRSVGTDRSAQVVVTSKNGKDQAAATVTGDSRIVLRFVAGPGISSGCGSFTVPAAGKLDLDPACTPKAQPLNAVGQVVDANRFEDLIEIDLQRVSNGQQPQPDNDALSCSGLQVNHLDGTATWGLCSLPWLSDRAGTSTVEQLVAKPADTTTTVNAVLQPPGSFQVAYNPANATNPSATSS